MPKSSKFYYQGPKLTGLRENLPLTWFDLTSTGLCFVLVLVLLIHHLGVRALQCDSMPTTPIRLKPS